MTLQQLKLELITFEQTTSDQMTLKQTNVITALDKMPLNKTFL
jgi:hypothetical protein